LNVMKKGLPGGTLQRVTEEPPQRRPHLHAARWIRSQS
jgi:hypothetical protein